MKPTLSIGLPVYNGEKYLDQAIESILRQTYSNFELIISDNGSTDGTQKICEHYLSKDERIRYYHNQTNLGAAWNFNHVYHLSSGKYFKWVSDDDLMDTDLLTKCVAVLEKDISIILCHPMAIIIDERGNALEEYNPHLATDSLHPHKRFRDLLRGHKCFEIFGVIRSESLRKTPLIGNFSHGDGILLARLSLIGRFYQLPEYLFFPRKHDQQSMNQFGVYNSIIPDYYSYSTWFDPGNKHASIIPHLIILREYLNTIWVSPIKWQERFLCYFFIIKWIRRMYRYLIRDLNYALKTLIGKNIRKLKSFRR